MVDLDDIHRQTEIYVRLRHLLRNGMLYHERVYIQQHRVQETTGTPAPEGCRSMA